jgi:hypothetical protein
VNDREKQLQERRTSLARSIAAMAAVYPGAVGPGAKFSGPWIEVFFEGWAKVGFRSRMGHYWRRRPEDRVLSMCGVSKALQYTIRGQVMIFEVGNFDKCAKCSRMRQRAKS